MLDSLRRVPLNERDCKHGCTWLQWILTRLFILEGSTVIAPVAWSLARSSCDMQRFSARLCSRHTGAGVVSGFTIQSIIPVHIGISQTLEYQTKFFALQKTMWLFSKFSLHIGNLVNLGISLEIPVVLTMISSNSCCFGRWCSPRCYCVRNNYVLGSFSNKWGFPSCNWVLIEVVRSYINTCSP